MAEAGATAALLEGIPQDGTTLGLPDAPVTLVEYGDIQCPFCAQWSDDAFEEIVRDYVRTGDLKIVFRGLAFLGPESEDGLRAVLAAGAQDKLWNVLHLIYENQGAENSGWVTVEFLRTMGSAVPGLDVERMLADRDSGPVADEMSSAANAAAAVGMNGVPSFEVGLSGGQLGRLAIDAVTADEFRPVLDDLLGR